VEMMTKFGDGCLSWWRWVAKLVEMGGKVLEIGG
jgi:hypothetical protein